MSYDQTQVAFVDTETTGLDPEHHEIWEIAVIVDGVEHCWLQQYQGSADAWVLENTRLASTDFSTAATRRQSIMRFAELTRGRHLVGACPWFDSERLHRQLIEKAGVGATAQARALPWHYHLIDVEALAVGALAERHADGIGSLPPLPWKSDDLSRMVGVEPDDFKPKHSALTDARWAKAIFEAIVGEPLTSGAFDHPLDV